VDLATVAGRHYRRQVALARRIAGQVTRLWRGLDPRHVAASWHAGTGARVQALVTAGQVLSAADADGYVAAALAAQDTSAEAAGQVVPQALAGVASDGRPLDTLLFEPVIATLAAVRDGARIEDAMAGGLLQLDTIVRTQLADAGRVADGIASTAAPAVTGYVRMLVPPSCARCVILAGREYRWSAGFERHPRCDCRHVPVAENIPGDVRTDPRRYFEALDKAEQDRVFGKAGAQAVRDGADLARVVNAHRGLYVAAGRKLTREAVTSRGTGRRVRLMPEQIYREAAGDREEALRLLRLHGYLLGGRKAAVPRSAGPAGDRYATAAREGDALAAARAVLGRRDHPGQVSVTRAQADALRDYVSSLYYAVNGQLRRGDLDPLVARRVERIDAVMARAGLDRDVVAWRGIAHAEKPFGDRLAGDMTGYTWREDAYVSTSAVRRQAQAFTYHEGQVLMRLLVPRGTGAVRLSGQYDQAELLLRRGLHLRVVADRGVSPDGYRLLDVEVIGG
jgi:hypothetical protein